MTSLILKVEALIWDKKCSKTLNINLNSRYVATSIDSIINSAWEVAQYDIIVTQCLHAVGIAIRSELHLAHLCYILAVGMRQKGRYLMNCVLPAAKVAWWFSTWMTRMTGSQ